MTPIEIKRKIESGEPIDRALLAAQADAQARQIGNGYAVLEGLSMDVIDGNLTINAAPVQWDLLNKRHLFVVACMLDSIRVGTDVLDQWLIDLKMQDQLSEEKVSKYVLIALHYAKKKN